MSAISDNSRSKTLPFKYHPPTRSKCKVCEYLLENESAEPIIDVNGGKASSANNFPVHNWYNFVLGYTPEFPQYLIEQESLTPDDLVLDPFMGSGTTLVACKFLGIPSQGIDANDFMVDAARVKLNWDVDLDGLKQARDQFLINLDAKYREYSWVDHGSEGLIQHSLFETAGGEKQDYRLYVEQRRPEMLTDKYLSDKPFAKISLAHDLIEDMFQEGEIKAVFVLALLSIIVPISNVRYGPGFGVGKQKDDVDVLGVFADKLNTMIRDLESTSELQRQTTSDVVLGDARQLHKYFESNSVSRMITSPPYPGDHEYTKHTRLELIFAGYATDHKEFRVIKQRMLRGSTTNIYKNDNDRADVSDMESIAYVTDLIQQRLEKDGATSGFEKLYTKLVWEYFGGMHKALEECFEVLKPGGKISLLVSDSHAFKMVHIQTAAILREIGEKIGYVNPEIRLWQLKNSTSHRYFLRENILTLQKPIS